MSRGRLLVVSHAAVLPENQPVYTELRRLGWEPTVVVPARWRHGYSPDPFAAAAVPELETCLHPIPVALAGRPQRHVYRARPGSLLRRLRPVAAFLEEESVSVPALLWGLPLHRAGVPAIESRGGIRAAAEALDALLLRAIERGARG